MKFYVPLMHGYRGNTYTDESGLQFGKRTLQGYGVTATIGDDLQSMGERKRQAPPRQIYILKGRRQCTLRKLLLPQEESWRAQTKILNVELVGKHT